jgi:poly(hydroxyalkanoate) granule-associated protein
MAQTTRKDGRAQALQESVEQVWLAGLGALALTEEEGSKFFRSLVKKGEALERRSRARLDQLMTSAKRAPSTAVATIERRTDATLENVMHRLGVPTRRDIDSLNRRIEGLTVVKASKPRARRPAARRTRKSAEGTSALVS